jgi:rod shape-determining protein MreD
MKALSLRLLPLVGLLATALAYQLFASSFYEIADTRPDFVFLALVYLAFYLPVGRVLLFGLCVSVFLDLLSIAPFGSHVIGYLPVLWLASRVRGWFVLEIPLARACLVFPAMLVQLELQRVFLVLTFDLQSTSASPSFLGFRDVFFVGDIGVALYTTVLGFVVHTLLDRFRPQLIGRRRRARPGWR